MESEERAPSRLGRYDTQHVVFRTRGMSEEQLEAGYWRVSRFLPLGIDPARRRHQADPDRPSPRVRRRLEKFEPLWDLVIRAKRIARMRPVLESVLSCFGLRSQPPRPVG